MQVLMGVINFQNSSTFCLVESSSSYTNLQQQVNRRKFVAMASIIPVEQVNNGPLQVTTGDSFIRHHLRKLAPYQPILPFEVCFLTLNHPILYLTLVSSYKA
jgi:histidinol-phosphate aminotransferase